MHDGTAQDVDGPFRELIDIGRGRTIEVRETAAGDAQALHGFYAPLSIHDLHRRFFSSWHPTLEWCHDWATVGERGGFGVLAVLHDAPAAVARDADRGEGRDGPGVVEGAAGGTVIAEAGYAMRSDGDGDLAVTVAPEWRGWLGGYLVDVLVRHASKAGLRNLQAEVLLENRPMLAVLRHRGAVNLEHDNGEVRLTIGTEGSVPTFPVGQQGPKVLVEVGSGRWSGERLANDAGCATAMCGGPDRRARHGCPVLRGERCPLADEADAIVVLFDPADPRTDQLIEAHRRNRPGVPIFVAPRRDDVTPAPEPCIEVGADAAETVDHLLSLLAPPRP